MAKAERVVQKELKRLGWREKEFTAQRKGDPENVRLAMLLRQNTTMTIDWIADRFTHGDARAFIASVVLGRQNEAEAERKKMKVTIQYQLIT